MPALSGRPELSVVILSRGEPTLADAVASVLAQDEPVELVVSHSGDERGLRAIRDRHPGLRIDATTQRRTPGAARNAGIAVTTGGHVAFLAADCVALPGWVGGRLCHHRRGAHAVASAMHSPAGPPAALASHLLQHATRMAHLTSRPVLRFGLSYSRDALDAHGPFPTDMEGEEDVRFNARLLAAGVEVVLAPDVLTAHRYPDSLRGLLRDQRLRGRRRRVIRGGQWRRSVLGARALLDAPAGAAHALAPGTPVPRSAVLRCAPHLVLGALATAAGIGAGPTPS